MALTKPVDRMTPIKRGRFLPAVVMPKRSARLGRRSMRPSLLDPRRETPPDPDSHGLDRCDSGLIVPGERQKTPPDPVLYFAGIRNRLSSTGRFTSIELNVVSDCGWPLRRTRTVCGIVSPDTTL